MAQDFAEEFFKVDPETPHSQIRPVLLRDALYDKLSPANKDSLPAWLRELCEDHKSTWAANSKGGEPNHREGH